MVRRSLGVALWSIAGLLASFLGALGALVGTGAGRALLARAAREGLADALAGSVQVAGASGGLLTGITLTGVRLYDPDSSLVATLPRAELSYNPLDLAAGRVVFLEVRLTRPRINIVQHANGRLNIEELLRLGRPDSGPRRPAPLILLRNVEIDDGTLILRLQDRPSPGDSALEIEDAAPDGRRRVRRFDRLHVRLATLRISAPRERGVMADVRALAFYGTDPALRMIDAQGRVLGDGDSLELDLRQVRLPGSAVAVRGRLRWPRDTVLYALDVSADSATLGDFRWIDPRFPAPAVLRGRLALRSRGGRFLDVRADPVDLLFNGGTLEGRVTGLSEAGVGLVAVRDGDLRAADFDLEFARPFLDTLPFAGRLSGRTVVDGRLSALALEADWSYRDSLVEGWPVTTVRGRGTVDVHDREGIAFRPFTLEAVSVDLGTVRRLLPAFRLWGALDAVGTLDGPYTNARFDGWMRHRDGDRPPSVARGAVRLDSRGDTLGVAVDVVADSLSFDALRGSFPSLPLRGIAAGTITLAGTVAELETHADLRRGDGGRVRGDGVLTLIAPRYGARDFTLRASDVDLRRWLDDAPASRLSLTVSGSADVDSGVPPAGRVTVVLEPSLFAGVALDAGGAQLRFTESRLELDSLRVRRPGLIASGSGALGWRAGTPGAITLNLDADSLSELDSLVAWVAGARGREGAPAGAGALVGSARLTVTLTGSLDSLTVALDGSGRGLEWRRWVVPAWEGHARLAPGPVPAFEGAITLDSVGRDELAFGAVSAAATGTADSLHWFGRGRVGEVAAVLAGGRYARRRESARADSTTVAVDSLALLLPGGVWLLERPALLTLGDSVTRLDTVALKALEGPGRLWLYGDLPTAGRADAAVQLESFPLAGVFALLQRDTLGVSGALTSSIGLAGTRREPVLHGSFSLAEASVGAFRIPFLDGTVGYRDRRLDGTLQLWRLGARIADASWHLPLDLALAPVAERQLPDTLSVQARVDSVDLTLLETLTPLVRQVTGALTADVGIGGRWDAPVLRGGLRIDHAGAFIPALNVRYEDVNGQLTLGGDTIRIDSLTARGERGRGRLAATGFVRLERLTRPVLALGIEADQFKALDQRNYLTATISGRQSLTGPVIGATLTGRGTVTSGVLYFEDLVTKRVVKLDAPWVADLIDTSLIRRERLGPEFQSRFLDSLRIRELQVAMGSDVWLRSNEANIQLTGTLDVSKERDQYRLTGTLQAPRGTYRLAVGPVTRQFTVTRGTVRYFGTPDLDAGLDISARHVVRVQPTALGGAGDTITIVAHIGGTLLVPQLELSAEGRELSQTEIISYLMFGLPAAELATDQASYGSRNAALSQAVSAIVGVGVAEAERFLVSDLGVPLDYFELRPTDPTNLGLGGRVAAGWQIGRKTFLMLNAGFCPGKQVQVTEAVGASFQFRLNSQWRTEASFEPVLACGTTAGGQTAVTVKRQVGFDLFWERRY